MIVALAIVAALAIAGLVYVTLRSQLAPGPVLTGRTLIVHTRQPDDRSLRGVLVAQHADRLTLSDVVYLHHSGDQAAGGVVHVPIDNVSTIQEIDR